jgi:hypothetical protein
MSNKSIKNMNKKMNIKLNGILPFVNAKISDKSEQVNATSAKAIPKLTAQRFPHNKP